MCINRNILECKDKCWCDLNDMDFVLIETYWNVKFNKIDLNSIQVKY